MRTPDAAARERLAAAVTRARQRAGYASIAAFADAVGISSKTLGALEAGRRVSDKTILATAQALTISDEALDAILAAPAAATVGAASDDGEVIRYQRPPGLADAEWEQRKQLGEKMLDVLFDHAVRNE